MDSATYQHYLNKWKTQIRENSNLRKFIFPIPKSESETIISSLYRAYSNFARKIQVSNREMNLLQEKFFYDSKIHRYGFRSIFEVIDRSNNKTEKMQFVLYLQSHLQHIFHSYRSQFRAIIQEIFNEQFKIEIKVRCKPQTCRMKFMIKVITSE